MKPSYCLPAAATYLAAAIVFVTPARAQKTEHSDVLLLPEFSVNAQAASDSYTAGDTTSGSRTSTAIKDLPYSVSSISAQFMKDFAIVGLTDDLSYISAITGNTDSLTFSVRGFTGGNNALVNGHYRYTPLVAGQVERVELIKGPSGSIYGQTNPGGTLFVSTFQPRATEGESINVTVGSYQLNSTVVHLTGPIPIGTKPKLFYQIDATSLHRLFDNPGIHRKEKSLAGTLLFKPDDRTSLSIGVNWQRFYVPIPGDWAVPYTVHTGTNPYTKANMTYYDGFAWWLRHANYASTYDYILRGSTGLTATFQRRLTDWLSFQMGYDTYHTPAETYNVLGSGGTINTGTGLIGAGATPTWTTIYGTGWSYSADLLAHYSLGATENKTLLTVDDYLNNRRDYGKSTIAGTFTPGFTSFNPLLPLPTIAFDPRDDAHWTAQTTRNNAVYSEGISLNHEMALFDRRLFLYAGYRHDRITGFESNPSAAGPLASATTYSLSGNARESRIHDSNDAGHVGVSVRLSKAISAYASVYQGFQPFGTSVPITVNIPAGSTPFVTQQLLKALSPASTTSLGEEVGVKADYLEHAVVFGADVFHTKQQNVGVTELSDPTNPSSPTVTVNEGDQISKGFECDAEFKLTTSLHGYLSYSYADVKVENQGINVLANGHRPRGVPYDSMSGSLKYTIRHGWSVQTSAHYQGSSPALSPSTGLIKNPATGLNDATDGRMNIRTPIYATVTLGTAYTWKTGHLEHYLNVTVKNLFNRVYTQSGNATAYIGDGRGVYVSYSLKH